MSTLNTIARCILDQDSTDAQLRAALDAFLEACSEVSGVQPDRSFSAWADDSFLPSGVAINPQAAAHCVTDYRRSVVFMRGLFAALQSCLERYPDRPLHVLYAGCGPYATLMLPLLSYFKPGELQVSLLDIHLRSLDSVQTLLRHFDLLTHEVHTVQADASRYQHPHPLHLIVAETMQKSLEQEPQVAVTCNLAPQLCEEGLFLPQRIDVDLVVSGETGKTQDSGHHHRVARVFSLDAMSPPDLAPRQVELPAMPAAGAYNASLLTHIKVFGDYRLSPGEAEITLPRPCPEIQPLRPGETFEIAFQTGSYPGFTFAHSASG
jgi:hypothetical protein